MDKKYLIFIFVALSILIFNPYPFLGGDNVVYSVLGKSLISGNGYAEIHKPNCPPHTQYPPAFPILLAPVVTVFGLNLTILKFIPFLAGLVAIFLYAKINWGDSESNLLTLSLFAFSPLIINYSSRVLTEIPFLAAIIGSIYCFQKKKDLFAWLLAVLALYIRSAGIFLVASYLLYYLIQRDFRRLLYSFGIFAALYLPWNIRNRIVGGGTSYITQFFSLNPYRPELGKVTFGLFFTRIFNNFQLYLFHILPRSFTHLLGSLSWILGVGLLGTTIIGLISAPKELKFIRFLVVIFSITLLTWPTVWSSDRFLLPGLPFLFPFLVLGTSKILKANRRYLIIGIISLCIVTLIISIPQALQNKIHYIEGNREYGLTADWQNYRRTCLWAKENLDSGTIVSRKPEFAYLWSNHKSTIYPFSDQPDIVWTGIKDHPYVLVDAFYWSASTQKYLIPALLQNRTKIRALYKTGSPETWLLKIENPHSR